MTEFGPDEYVAVVPNDVAKMKLDIKDKVVGMNGNDIVSVLHHHCKSKTIGATAIDKGNTNKNCLRGWGRVDAYAAVNQVFSDPASHHLTEPAAASVALPVWVQHNNHLIVYHIFSQNNILVIYRQLLIQKEANTERDI